MKLSNGASLIAALAAAPSANAFTFVTTSPDRTATGTALQLSSGRREFLGSVGSAFSRAALAFAAGSPASASLLDEYGADPKQIKEKPKEVAAAPKKGAKEESSYEPNLRANYYYPTNKKRYLPRIKKCSDAIPDAAQLIGSEDWEGATEFALKVADDTILPMKLYTSSLTGGGTNVKVAFAKDMMKDAGDFEKAQKRLVKAIGKKDQEASSRALEDLSQALLSYRTTGRLLGADGGGDIPSVDEIRRSACRVQGRTFEKKIQARDSRVASAS